MKFKFSHILFVVVITSLIFSCGKWPDIVNSKNDIMKLSPDVTSIRARGLPEEDFPSLKRLNSLKTLDFSGGHAIEDAKISDQGLLILSNLQLQRLDTLTLGYCYKITDAGLKDLPKMITLKWISLMACTGITDNGLRYLVPMSNLQAIDLRGCPNITNKGILILAEMKNLKGLLLGGCEKVTIGGAIKLRALMPNCKVIKDEKEWSRHQPPKEIK